MKYYQMFIDTDGTKTHYDAVSGILELKPYSDHDSEHEDFKTWMYLVQQGEDDPYYDFINNFLDLLEPRLNALAAIGITNKHILFWLVYEYEHQCAMFFEPQQMQRLGQQGIYLNIDCREILRSESKSIEQAVI